MLTFNVILSLMKYTLSTFNHLKRKKTLDMIEINNNYIIVCFFCLFVCLFVFFFVELLWKAPEQLRQPELKPTKEGDVYGAGIIMQEIVTRGLPFDTERQKMEVKGTLKYFRIYFITVLCTSTRLAAHHLTENLQTTVCWQICEIFIMIM